MDFRTYSESYPICASPGSQLIGLDHDTEQDLELMHGIENGEISDRKMANCLR